MTMLPAAKQVSSVQSLPYCLFMRLYGTWSELELYDDDNDNDFFFTLHDAFIWKMKPTKPENQIIQHQ